MLPIYEAIDIIDVISEKAGHTKPWVVMAKTPNGLKAFIVKLYSTEQVDQFHCVSKEIICNLLASEFDFTVPQCALIQIPEELSFKLSSENQQQYDNADCRPKFATQMIDSVKNAIPTLPKKYFQQRISLDTLYAFDNFIRNSDRGHPKTNLLLHSKDAFLIDHELTLNYQDIVNIDFRTLQLEDKFSKYHLFYSYLSKSNKKTKQKFFIEFEFYLNSLNINMLKPYFNQLVNEGFDDYSQPICNWLSHVKQNSTIFVNKLKGSLQ